MIPSAARAFNTLLSRRASCCALLTSTVPQSPDLTTGAPWTRWPRGWIAGAATVLVVVVVALLTVLRS